MNEKQQYTNHSEKTLPLMNSNPLPMLMHTIPTKKPAWEIARDISMEMLSRKASKLSYTYDHDAASLFSDRSDRNIVTRDDKQKHIETFVPSRIPRMPTNKQAEEALISHDWNCSICSGPCIESYLRCRVCIKIYHSRCLFLSGHTDNPSFILPRIGIQDWSCPECIDIRRLLSSDELSLLMHAFEYIDRNNDGFINLDEYLSLGPNEKIPEGFELFIQHNYELGRNHFGLMDVRRTGTVSWSEFASFYACKLMVAKNSSGLLKELSDKELARSKIVFMKDPKKTYDNDGNILINRSYLHKVRFDLVNVLKEKYGKRFIDVILDYNPDESTLINDQQSLVNWEEFLRETVLLTLLNRANKISNTMKKIEMDQTSEYSISSSSPTLQLPRLNMKHSRRSTIKQSKSMSIMHGSSSIDGNKTISKYRRMVEKLNEKEYEAELKRRKLGSVVNYSIVESFDEKENINMPKLKPNQRDHRYVVIDPWTSARDLERLRNQPISIKSVR